MALTAFGLKGFEAVSTRDIAEAAGVNQPAILYYVGSKAELYLDCARHIVDRYVAANRAVSLEAYEIAVHGGTPDQCRDQLLRVLTTLGRFLAESDEATVWSIFIQRELADPGPAFDVLFEQLWRPGVDLVTLLIQTARGRPPGAPAEPTEAIQLISGITAFASGRPAINRFYPSPPSTATFSDLLVQMIARQVRQIAGGDPLA